MKTRNTFTLVTALLLALALLAGCGQPTATTVAPAGTTEPAVETTAAATTAATEPAATTAKETAQVTTAAPVETTAPAAALSFKDMMGNEIKLDKPLQRVVALTASDCEILYAVGAGDLLVGRGKYCDYPEAVKDIPVVDSGKEMNVEQVLALKPDIVLMSTMAQTEEQIAQLARAGVPSYVTNAKDIAGVYEAVRGIGELTGKPEQAEQVIKDMKATFADIAAKVKDKGAADKTIYFEVSPLEYGLWAAGKNTFMAELAEIVGLKNAFDDVDGWGKISEEQVISRDPDYIVTITMYMGEGPEPVEEIMARKGWENLKAVKNKTIFLADSDEISRPAPRLAEAVKALYDFIYK